MLINKLRIGQRVELKEQSIQIRKWQNELQVMTSRTEALDAYQHRDILLIAGLPTESFAEAAATADAGEVQQSQYVEQSVLKLFNSRLGVAIKPISSAYRPGLLPATRVLAGYPGTRVYHITRTKNRMPLPLFRTRTIAIIDRFTRLRNNGL